MQSDKCCEIARTYSAIPGFQDKAKDTYSLTAVGAGYLVMYQSKGKNLVLCEKMNISGLSFSEIKGLLSYMSENAVRWDTWKDVVRDYCITHGAVSRLVT